MHNEENNLLQITGTLKKGACVVIVRTEWNEAILHELERGCREVLEAHGVQVKTVTVPGAVEIPFAISAYSRTVKGRQKADAFVALGCVIKGDTPHFEYVCSSVTIGVSELNVSLKVPVIFGVLTVYSEQQAWERLGGAHGHKGREAGAAALKMMQLVQDFKKEKA